MPVDKRRAWALDQLQKSLFFHQRLHDWGLVEVAKEIEGISGESLEWDLQTLDISNFAWNRIIHSGIKPILVFAHPDVLRTVPKAVSYYRMLSMVSQKSMSQLGMATGRFEQGDKTPKSDLAARIAKRVNSVICALIESEHRIERREFDIWRGMAAGAQAQGSWQNRKGDVTEAILREDLLAQLKRLRLIEPEFSIDLKQRNALLELRDGRIVRMGSEPDILIRDSFRIQAAVEIKGGIDPAGVLERVGAAIKSLSRAKEESPGAITILLVSATSMSDQAERDILSNRSNVNYWFTVEDILQNSEVKQNYYSLMGLGHEVI